MTLGKPTATAPEQPLPVVLVVDDDRSLSLALDSLFRSVGLQVHLFTSVRELLDGKWPDAPSCLVLDIRLPGLSGLDFQAQLAREHRQSRSSS